jgi:hypothetical protein
VAVVVDVGEPVPLGVGGTFARVFRVDDGWELFWAAGGDLQRLPMGDDLTVEDVGRVALTGRDDLQDHAIVRCPDGTWLHVATGSTVDPNDSAWTFRYDAALNLVASAPVAEGGELRLHDIPLVCSPLVDATAGYTGFPNVATYLALDADGAPGARSEMEWVNVTGSSLVYDEDTDTLVGFGVTTALFAGRLDADLRLLSEVEVPVAADAYWPQGVVRAGDHWLLAYMARGDGAFADDTGDVRLAVLDLDFALVEDVAITDWGGGDGAMRPGLALDGERLLVSFDRAQEAYVVEVTLDLGSGEAADTGDTGEPEAGAVPPTRDCGCGGGSAWLLVGLVPRGNSRRQDAKTRRRQEG